MRLFVLGSSGGVGRHVVAQACAAGHDVTVFVRDASAGGFTSSPAKTGGAGGLTVVRGEVLDDGLSAMAGHDAVVSSLGIKRKSPSNPWSALTSPADFCSRSGQRIIEAMGRQGVKRIVAVSAAGVADSAPAMNGFMKFLVATSSIGVAYRDLAVMEAGFHEAGLRAGIEWLCPRPTRLTNGPRTDKAHQIHGFPMSAAIARADVAAWMLAALTVADWGAAWPSRTPQITSTP